MKKCQGYQVVPFAMHRRAIAASASVGRQQNNIQASFEVDITDPRRFMREHQQRTGEKLSLTAFVVSCLAQAVAEHPHLNAFRKGRKLILLDDVTIGVLVERNIAGEDMPETLGIRAAQTKTYQQIHNEIRAAQDNGEEKFGGLSGFTWIRFIPGFLMRTFIRAASHNIGMMKRFGAVGVTAVGMFGKKNQALWLIPLSGGATVTVTVGGIVERPVIINEQLENHEHLCLTASFNHDIVDGAPAVRFVKRFSELLVSSEKLRAAVNENGKTLCL
jgi:pyruvate/2-oxoglutarate dehydrogenase complex dihydrolipoamide acyltransferase (E2) component